MRKSLVYALSYEVDYDNFRKNLIVHYYQYAKFLKKNGIYGFENKYHESKLFHHSTKYKYRRNIIGQINGIKIYKDIDHLKINRKNKRRRMFKSLKIRVKRIFVQG
ncbi:hypothetical protein KHQ82_08780 [Mycoplasmatota bacterium]|nr:hypothetical protein KHQ82_08780 [Mycoplasmatota bacterium]